MYSIVALVCCVGVAAGSLCVVPPQWESQGSFLTTIVYNGKPQISKGSFVMAYDAVLRRTGQYETILINDRPAMTVGVLMDFKTNTKYVLHEGTCYMETLGRQEFPGSIPDNATQVGTRDVVGFGTNAMTVNTYAMEYGSVGSYVSLTADGCVPVVETIRGTLDGVSFLQNNHYWNVSAGISNPDGLRVPPTGCENAALFQSTFNKAGVNSVFGKRSFFGF